MKPINIEFSKIEFGTRFYDPVTGGKYIKISEHLAEMDDERYDEIISFDMNPIDYFEDNEIITV